MTGAGEPKSWLRAKIDALLHAEWIGNAGKLFRKAGEVIEDYNDQYAHVDDKMHEAPEVLWKSAQIKSSQTDLNFVQVEEKKIGMELARKSMLDKLRQEKAAADLAETNAQIAKVQLAKAVLDLSNGLKDAGTIMRFSKDGSVTVCPAPEGYDYSALNVEVKKALTAGDTSIQPQPELPSESSDTAL
jgi:hypothetical protein